MRTDARALVLTAPRHLSSTLPCSVSKTLPACLTGLAEGIAVAEPSTSLRLGPVGPLCCCCATAQTFCCMLSVFCGRFLADLKSVAESRTLLRGFRHI